MMTLHLVVLAVLVVCCLLLEAFFSGSETAIISSDKAQLRAESRRGNRRAALAASLYSRSETLLSTTLVGTNLAVVTATSLATVVIAHCLPHVSKSTVTTLIMAPLILIFGEVVPKSIARASAQPIALLVAAPLRMAERVMHPIVVLVSWVAESILGLLGSRRTGASPFVTREELIAMAEIGEEHGLIAAEERRMIQSVLELHDRPVSTVMVPLVAMVSVEAGATVARVEELAGRTGFSLFPVYEGRVDDVIGIVSALEVLHAGPPADPAATAISAHVRRDVLYVPDTKSVGDLLRELYRGPRPMAIVVDEHGGVVGMTTTQDLVQEIIGRIHDERHEQAACVMGRDGVFECDGRAHVEELAERAGMAIEREDFETVAGLVTKLIGRIPRVGEVVQYGPFLIEILDADPRRVKRLRFIRAKPLPKPPEKHA